MSETERVYENLGASNPFEYEFNYLSSDLYGHKTNNHFTTHHKRTYKMILKLKPKWKSSECRSLDPVRLRLSAIKHKGAERKISRSSNG